MRAVLSFALLTALAGGAAAAPAGKAYHVMRPLNLPPADHHFATAGPTLLYYGGPVLPNASPVVVFWGSGLPPATLEIGALAQALPVSTYADLLAQYATVNVKPVEGQQGSNQPIGHGTFAGQFTITPANAAKSLTDAEIQAELQAQITAGKLPPQTPNTLYLLYFPKDVTVTLDGMTSCTDFGAYHAATPNNAVYAVIPACFGGFRSVTIATSHEFAAAVTDTIPSPGANPAHPQAWMTPKGEEIGDLCEGYFTTLKSAGRTFTVQRIFDQVHGTCATGKFTGP